MHKEPQIQRLLLIEDNSTDVILTKRAFRHAGFEVEIEVAQDGDTALDLLRRQNGHGYEGLPEMVLCDINMPGKNGKEVLREIKADDALRHLPVVMFTTSDSQRDIYESYYLQASGYVVKPTSLDDFLGVARSLKYYWSMTVELALAPAQQI